MHFNDMREAQHKDSVNHHELEFAWENEKCPCLHSGFITGSSADPKFNVLYLSMWFAEGIYLVRLNDRETRSTAYIELDSLKDFFETIELKLAAGRVAFRPSKTSEKGNW